MTAAAGFFGAYVDNDDRNSERYLVNLVQGGLGLPDESYYREDKFAEIRTAYEAYVARMFALAGLDDTEGRAARHGRARDPHRPGPLGRVPTPATSSRPTTC